MYTDVESQRLFDVIEKLGYLPFYPTTLEPAVITKHSEDLVLIHKTKVNDYI